MGHDVPWSDRQAAMTHLAVHRTAKDVFSALWQLDVPGVLLKGPTLAFLYPDIGRAYGDVDVLVPLAEHDRVQQKLRNVGFTPRPTIVDPTHARTWDGPLASVDLHHSFHGIGAEHEVFWDHMSSRAEPMHVNGVEVQAPALVDKLLLVALHAREHQTKTMLDLERALARCDQASWRAAAAAAQDLGAGGAFVAALELLPQGHEMLSELGMDGVEPSQRQRRRVRTPSPVGTLKALRDMPHPWRWILRMLFPPPAALRRWSDAESAGPVTTAWLYVRRWAHLAGKTAAAVRLSLTQK